MPADQRAAFLKRFSLSEEPGKALVTSGPQNRPIVRCQAPGGTAEFRFGEERVHDNLAFIRVDVVDSEQTNFGLIREDGVWRLISLGLVMLDVPQLSKEWAKATWHRTKMLWCRRLARLPARSSRIGEHMASYRIRWRN